MLLHLTRRDLNWDQGQHHTAYDVSTRDATAVTRCDRALLAFLALFNACSETLQVYGDEFELQDYDNNKSCMTNVYNQFLKGHLAEVRDSWPWHKL